MAAKILISQDPELRRRFLREMAIGANLEHPHILPVGNLYFILRQFQKSLAEYNKVIRLSPGNAEAYFLRGRVYYTLGYPEKGWADMHKALQLNSWIGKVFPELLKEASKM